MNAKQFVDKYYHFAMQSQAKTGVPALVIMAQAALETGWGKVVLGNMMFGKKDDGVINGNEQLILTTEFINSPDKKFPEILSITKVSEKLWKYRVRDWFRKYNTPEESFTDHAKLLSTSSRYAKAMIVKDDPFLFAAEIHKAGYATDPDYTKKLHSIIRTIENLLPK